MPITTVDEVIAGQLPTTYFTKVATPTLVAGRPHSLFYLAGNPGANNLTTTGTVSTTGTAITSITGQIPFSNPPTGQFTYLSRFGANATIGGTLLLCDRLWHGGISDNLTVTTTGTVSSVAFPPRDVNGSSNGVGVLLGVEVYIATGAGTPSIQVEYTNSSGTANRYGVNTVATVASSARGAFHPISLQAGDVGVRSVQSVKLSATWTQGDIRLVAYRVLASVDLLAPFLPNSIDALTGGFPRLYDNTTPFLIFIPSTTTASVIGGTLNYATG